MNELNLIREELEGREAQLKLLTEECDSLRRALEILEHRKPSGGTATSVRWKTTATVSNEKCCKRCNKGTKDGATFWKHAAFADGLDNHCKNCRDKMRQEKKARAKLQQPKPNGHAAVSANGIKIPCDVCGIPFPNAKEMGLHKTREHFRN